MLLLRTVDYQLPFELKKECGGEGGIRTPGTLTGTPDFESGAFNRALPPLRFDETKSPTHSV